MSVGFYAKVATLLSYKDFHDTVDNVKQKNSSFEINAIRYAVLLNNLRLERTDISPTAKAKIDELLELVDSTHPSAKERLDPNSQPYYLEGLFKDMDDVPEDDKSILRGIITGLSDPEPSQRPKLEDISARIMPMRAANLGKDYIGLLETIREGMKACNSAQKARTVKDAAAMKSKFIKQQRLIKQDLKDGKKSPLNYEFHYTKVGNLLEDPRFQKIAEGSKAKSIFSTLTRPISYLFGCVSALFGRSKTRDVGYYGDTLKQAEHGKRSLALFSKVNQPEPAATVTNSIDENLSPNLSKNN